MHDVLCTVGFYVDWYSLGNTVLELDLRVFVGGLHLALDKGRDRVDHDEACRLDSARCKVVNEQSSLPSPRAGFVEVTSVASR